MNTTTPQEPMILFRPHHFMCSLGFEGKGYSVPFVKNYQTIVDRLNKEPNTVIKITSSLDQICKACPNQKNANQCTKQDFIEKLDKAHAEILNFEEHQEISWSDAKKIIQNNMTLEKFHSACAGCEWKAYGICETALKKLLHPNFIRY